MVFPPKFDQPCMSPKSGNRFWDNDMHRNYSKNDSLAENCFAFYEAVMIKSEKPTIFRSEGETLKV
ncbi:MAG: hypothetical protein E5W55_18875, partial [Mesorhizobium sp.]